MQEQEQSEQRIEESEISVSEDENYKSIYTQNGYFYNSYIIEMGWNVYGDEYSDQTELILKDGSVMKVYFSDTSKDYIADKGAIATTTELLSYDSPETLPAPMLAFPAEFISPSCYHSAH